MWQEIVSYSLKKDFLFLKNSHHFLLTTNGSLMKKSVSRYTDQLIINTFYAASIFLYPLKISEYQSFSDVFKGYPSQHIT